MARSIKRQYQRTRAFYAHLFFFILVSVWLFVMDYVRDEHIEWAMWPVGIYAVFFVVGAIMHLWNS